MERIHKKEAASPTPRQHRRAAQMQDNRVASARQSGLAEAIQRSKANNTGMPDEVKTRMEESFGTDFSGVRVYPESAKAPAVGALAYTQGTDIHFAPGQFKPETTAGRQLLGHELTHVVQQAGGRVSPTTEVGGMPVNDDPALENEADAMGRRVAE